ncbi:MAG: capsular biosynthesis protein CpsI [Porticoccaceae bacterium]|nr:capsular biosynthesis protein CpsI [Porticoccaceae bacterium]
MKVLVTGSAGFIGSALCLRLLKRGDSVIGIDNHNDYYDVNLKTARLERHIHHANYKHLRINLADRFKMEELFSGHHFDSVVNLAAQAGVRYSIENPSSYVDSNLLGFANVLEGCRQSDVKHLVYASSSSVYGSNTREPFAVNHSVDHPVSFYAATKKANELMAHSYSHLYRIPTTGLRFFTVYGPYDRPDMALQKFTRAIMDGKSIKVFNFGKHKRDFTFIDDIIEGVVKVLDTPAKSNPKWNSDKPESSSSNAPYRLYNIGNNSPVDLLDYIECLEKYLGKKAKKEMLPIQPGDVLNTYADVQNLVEDFNYRPSTTIDQGIKKFCDWYLSYYSHYSAQDE